MARSLKGFPAHTPSSCSHGDSQTLEDIAEEINKSGGRAVGIIANVSDPSSIKNAFSRIEQEFKGAPPIAAAVFNASL